MKSGMGKLCVGWELGDIDEGSFEDLSIVSGGGSNELWLGIRATYIGSHFREID